MVGGAAGAAGSVFVAGRQAFQSERGLGTLMLDRRQIRDNPDAVKTAVQVKGIDLDVEMDFTSLEFMVPLLALVASEMACVSWETTLPRAESDTCNWPVTRFALCVKES